MNKQIKYPGRGDCFIYKDRGKTLHGVCLAIHDDNSMTCLATTLNRRVFFGFEPFTLAELVYRYNIQKKDSRQGFINESMNLALMDGRDDMSPEKINNIVDYFLADTDGDYSVFLDKLNSGEI